MSWYLLAFRKYRDFTGRARRKEYWYFTLFYGLGIVFAVVLDMLFGTFNPQFAMGWITVAYLLVSFPPMLAVSVRRLHDIGRSGWWVLLNAAPGFGSAALNVVALFDSQPGRNAFGLSPKEEPEDFPGLQLGSGMRPKKSFPVRLAKTVAIVAAVAATVCGSAWLWWSQNSAEFLANGTARFEKGRLAGRELDESGCVASAAGALDGEAGNSITAGISNSLELSGCLETSRGTRRFCDDIPSQTEILATGQWMANVCNQIGYGNNTSCQTMLQRIPEYCASEKRSKKMESDAIGKT
jgi:uncharacterized membrane protein YhaH (DUF805 family)